MKLFMFSHKAEDSQSYVGLNMDDMNLNMTSFAKQNDIDLINLDQIVRDVSIYSKLSTLIEESSIEELQNFIVNEEINYTSLLTQSEKVICVGLNYLKHAEETNSPIPKYPVLFNKFANSITSHGAQINIPREAYEMDYEAELAIVIGKETKDIDEEHALDAVFGYANVNDVSARDLQNRTTQWMLGKACDDFAPLGPYIVTADEIPNPNALEIKLTLNGEVRQHSNTSDMIFNCKKIISYISSFITLKPGDLIFTGTPEGVIVGLPQEERVWIKPGDVVTVEIEKLGELKNSFFMEE